MKQIIFTKKAPLPIGPYNQAILKGNTLFVSGQIAINSFSNELVINTIEEEANQVMQNIKAILEATDMTFENVVKSTIYIKNNVDFDTINKVYSKYFNEKTAPARETVQVNGLPKNANIEISVIAMRE